MSTYAIYRKSLQIMENIYTLLASGHKDHVTRRTNKAADVEIDGIMIPNSIVSLGTIIKREALKPHQLYLQNPKQLTDRQRKIMTAGFSSILDLSDQSYSSQPKLFDSDQWKYINNYSDNKPKMKEYPLDAILTNILIIIKNTLHLSNDLTLLKAISE
ncbi:hypothetical protein BDB01DRAFT_883928, partial [Pilobolus umbonatus]